MRARRGCPAQPVVMPVEIGRRHKAADERPRDRHAREHHHGGLFGGSRQPGDEGTEYESNGCQSADTTCRDLHGRTNAT